ncbi:MAG TPA: YSC84-related protein [Anaerohalosphaeraceae bacterium]|nr:YSC84-related protein [Anaerohalosphaeraceae bacterium]HOL87825.1 YSC84-related protein [Anaerohalosphaeraceae bacterium]HPP55177.1 YSC84-related protein [Anaerohalosphaeraceae bacterium]
MKRYLFSTVILLTLSAGCTTVPEKKETRDVLSAEIREAIALFKSADPSIQSFFDNAYGYAVFPRVTKGAFWVGGAYGRGEVFEHGRKIGYASLSQATLGFSFGGEFFREIVFFRQKQDLDRFRSGEFAFSAQATATAVTVGAAAKSDYKDGMAVFIMADRGLMVDASVGGQKFKFVEGVMK